MSVKWVDIKDTDVRPMACDMAQLPDTVEMRPATARRAQGFWGWVVARRQDPSRRTF